MSPESRAAAFRRIAPSLLRAAQAVLRRSKARARRVCVNVAARAFDVTLLDAAALERESGPRFRRYGPAERIEVPTPTAIGTMPAAFKARIGHWTLDESWAVEIPRARLLGPGAVGFSESGDILADTVIPENYRLPDGISLRAMARRFGSRADRSHAACATSLVGPWSQSYFHWVVEYLPRLELVRRYADDTGVVPRLIIDQNPRPWQLESLRLLGFAEDDVEPWNGTSMSVARLVVTAFPRRYAGPGRTVSMVSPRALRWMAAAFGARVLPPSRAPRARRILISRSAQAGRRVLNEPELLGALAQFGFRSYVLEEMSFAEQARTFAEADVVIGPHGAGLANIAFATSPVVVELIGGYCNASFMTLAASLQARYACIRCTPVGTGHPTRGNLMVDPDDVVGVLDSLGVPPL